MVKHGEYPAGENEGGNMSSQRSLHRGIDCSGKYPLSNCPLGKCQSRNCPDTNLLVKLSQWAALKSSVKGAMTSSSHRKPCAKPFSLSTCRFATFKRIIQNAVKHYQRVLLKVFVLKRSMKEAMTSCFSRAPSKKASSRKTEREMQFLKELQYL